MVSVQLVGEYRVEICVKKGFGGFCPTRREKRAEICVIKGFVDEYRAEICVIKRFVDEYRADYV